MGPMMAPDSDGYILYAQMRQFVYPFFLGGFRLFFHSENFMPVYIVQIILGVGACQMAATTFKRIFNLEPFAVFIVFLVFFSPYCLSCQFGNYILSKALAL